MKLAIIFPGIGYHCDKPLLYYSQKIAKQYGYSINEVHYSGFSKNINKNEQTMKEAFQLAYTQVLEQLKDINFQDYESILFIEKSIGTAVGYLYAQEKNLNVHHIYLTPVELSSKMITLPGIVFHGTNDPWANTEIVKHECKEKNLPLTLIEGGNHSLETNDIQIDIQNLEKIMKQIDHYIANL